MPMNPYQGLKQQLASHIVDYKSVTMPMNPYQGLKLLSLASSLTWLDMSQCQ